MNKSNFLWYEHMPPILKIAIEKHCAIYSTLKTQYFCFSNYNYLLNYFRVNNMLTPEIEEYLMPFIFGENNA